MQQIYLPGTHISTQSLGLGRAVQVCIHVNDALAQSFKSERIHEQSLYKY